MCAKCESLNNSASVVLSNKNVLWKKAASSAHSSITEFPARKPQLFSVQQIVDNTSHLTPTEEIYHSGLRFNKTCLTEDIFTAFI